MNQKQIEIHLHEYDKLADEIVARIGFRDNLLYVTLAAYGGVIAFILEKSNYFSLLALPLVSIILGWAYLVNDTKVSAIGKYIRSNLEPKLKKLAGSNEEIAFFEWEWFHRNDKHRVRRKIEQCLIDIVVFVGSGAGSLVAFSMLTQNQLPHVCWIVFVEAALLAGLFFEIIIYAEIKK